MNNVSKQKLAEADDDCLSSNYDADLPFYDCVRRHLEQEGSITKELAHELYGRSDNALSNAIWKLRSQGWEISTSRYRTEAKRLRTIYRVASIPSAADGEVDETHLDTPEYGEFSDTIPTARFVCAAPGAGAPMIKVVATGQLDSASFIQLSRAQEEYLRRSLNLLHEMNGKNDTA